ncbi:MAG: 50S ribosomal protein L24 [Euzebyaceae bacterium]|jgi:large subunit ribosomal protein L24|nr:50S ribosomal protein L24 [Euzebyaceae bacterium]
MQRIKRNDTVKVISGKDAGKEGRVVRVYPTADKVMVEGINRVTKHERVKTSRRGAQEGGISHVEAPLHVSNVMPVCPECGKPTRVGSKIVDSKKTRYCRRCDSEF